MNKVTKIGLTALAGSLAAVAGAQAGSLTVSGGSNITWHKASSNASSATQSITGNPLGWQNNLTFGASGELDNGISWTANAYNSDAQALTSSNITFDLAGMGKLLVDNGAGGAGLDALDDKTPSAWEEAYDVGFDSGLVTVSGVSGSASLTYTLPADLLPMGTEVRLAWTPRADAGGLQADKGSSALVSSNREARDITITMAPADGLSIFAGYHELERVSGSTNGGDDALQGAYGLTYSAGPISFGYAKSYVENDDGASTAVNYYENDNWSVAFNVNDNLSVSYAEWESEEHMGTGAKGGQTLEIDSMQIAYNMGGATLQIADVDGTETRYSAGATNHVRTIQLSLAF